MTSPLHDQTPPPVRSRTGRKQDKEYRNARRQHVWELRLAGATHGQIAEQVGCSLSTVANDIKVIAAKLQERMQDLAPRVRQFELDRLDRMFLALWPRIRKGDPGAINSALKIMERRAAYIPGLEVPKQLAVYIIPPEDLATIAEVDAMSVDDVAEAYRAFAQATSHVPALPGPVIDVSPLPEGQRNGSGGNGAAT